MSQTGRKITVTPTINKEFKDEKKNERSSRVYQTNFQIFLLIGYSIAEKSSQISRLLRIYFEQNLVVSFELKERKN